MKIRYFLALEFYALFLQVLQVAVGQMGYFYPTY